jgi:hypothetical protein
MWMFIDDKHEAWLSLRDVRGSSSLDVWGGETIGKKPRTDQSTSLGQT